MHKDIKNIIFDFGGVLINLDYQRTISAFDQLGFDMNRHFNRMAQSALFDRLETGKLDEPGFYQELRKLCENSCSDEELNAAWNAMILDLPMNRYAMLQQLNKRYRIFLLSNTNIIHARYFLHYIDGLMGRENWHNTFEKVYYSHELGLRKPDAEIYKWVLDDAGLNAHETIFLDDNAANVLAAESLGIRTVLVNTESIKLVEDLGLL